MSFLHFFMLSILVFNFAEASSFKRKYHEIKKEINSVVLKNRQLFKIRTFIKRGQYANRMVDIDASKLASLISLRIYHVNGPKNVSFYIMDNDENILDSIELSKEDEDTGLLYERIFEPKKHQLIIYTHKKVGKNLIFNTYIQSVENVPIGKHERKYSGAIKCNDLKGSNPFPSQVDNHRKKRFPLSNPFPQDLSFSNPFTEVSKIYSSTNPYPPSFNLDSESSKRARFEKDRSYLSITTIQ